MGRGFKSWIFRYPADKFGSQDALKKSFLEFAPDGGESLPLGVLARGFLIDLEKNEIMVNLHIQTQESRMEKYPVVVKGSLQKWEFDTWGWKNIVAAQRKKDPSRELINIEFPGQYKKYKEKKQKLKKIFVKEDDEEDDDDDHEDDEIEPTNPQEEVEEDRRRRRKENIKSNSTQKVLPSKLVHKQSSHQRKQADNCLENKCEEDKIYLVINKQLVELPPNSLKFLKISAKVLAENGLDDISELSESEVELEKKKREKKQVAKENPLTKLPTFKAEKNRKQQESGPKSRKSKRSRSQLPARDDESDLEPKTDQKKTREENKKKVVKGVRSHVVKENSTQMLHFKKHLVFPEGKIPECYHESFEKWDTASKSFVNALQRKEQKARLKELIKGGYNCDYLLHLLHEGINLEDIEKNVKDKEKDEKKFENGSEFFYHCKPFLSLEATKLQNRPSTK